MTKRLQILSEFKTPLPLMQAIGIKVLLPYESGSVLEKNAVDIVDAERGMIDVTITEFEMQGLKVGDGQNFRCEITMPDHKLVVLFSKGLNVKLEGERKVWR